MSQRNWFVDQVLSESPEVQLGTQYLYSNTGYVVVGAALEHITGQSWEDLMVERLFVPLGMDRCGFGPPASPGLLDGLWGHNQFGPIDSDYLYADNPPAIGPAGSVHCPLYDWAQFIQANLDGAAGDSSFLDFDLWTTLHTKQGDGYALGWVVFSQSWAGGNGLNHVGSNRMWYVVVFWAPALNKAYFVTTNIYNNDVPTVLNDVILALIE